MRLIFFCLLLSNFAGAQTIENTVIESGINSVNPDSGLLAYSLYIPLPKDFKCDPITHSCFQPETGTSIIINTLEIPFDRYKNITEEPDHIDSSSIKYWFLDTTLNNQPVLFTASHEFGASVQYRKLTLSTGIGNITVQASFTLPRYVPGLEQELLGYLSSFRIFGEITETSSHYLPSGILESTGFYFKNRIEDTEIFMNREKNSESADSATRCSIWPAWGNVVIQDTVSYAFEKLHKQLSFPPIEASEMIRFTGNGSLCFELKDLSDTKAGIPEFNYAAISISSNSYLLMHCISNIYTGQLAEDLRNLAASTRRK